MKNVAQKHTHILVPYKVYFKHHLQIQNLTQEMTTNSNPSSFEFKITFKPWLK
jgi:hypothetical protein